MSIHAPNPVPAKPASPFFAFLFLAVMALAFFGAGLILGVEPRLELARDPGGAVRGTGSNHFAGFRFFTKTVEGIESVRSDDAVRGRRSDSQEENRRRRKQKHLDLFAADGSRLGWDREADQQMIEAFLRGTDPSLALTDPPPFWRMGLAWFCVGFGALTLLGAFQSFFPKKAQAKAG